MAKYVIDEATMIGIAEGVRSVTGASNKMTPQSMIDRLQSAPSQEEVYLEAYELGHSDGSYDEWSRFWDEYQIEGTRTNYTYSFAGTAWVDKTYNPIYPILADAANYMFAYSRMSDTKVEIDASRVASNKTYMFQQTFLVTIRKLKVHPDTNYGSTFEGSTKLKNISVEGTIGRNWNMQWCPVSVESMKNIISCLQNHTGLDTANTYTLTFSEDCWAALEADSKAPDGGTWREYVNDVLCINT